MGRHIEAETPWNPDKHMSSHSCIFHFATKRRRRGDDGMRGRDEREVWLVSSTANCEWKKRICSVGIAAVCWRKGSRIENGVERARDGREGMRVDGTRVAKRWKEVENVIINGSETRKKWNS